MKILILSNMGNFGNYRNAPWYIQQKLDSEALAKKLGFNKVSEETSCGN